MRTNEISFRYFRRENFSKDATVLSEAQNHIAIQNHRVDFNILLKSDRVHMGTKPEPEFDCRRDDESDSASDPDMMLLGIVRAALCSTGYEQLRNVDVYCHYGRVVLQGRVASFYLKQVAQESIRRLEQVRDIDNDLKVLSR